MCMYLYAICLRLSFINLLELHTYPYLFQFPFFFQQQIYAINEVFITEL